MRILFVDDEPAVLAGLRRLFHVRHPDWQLTFAAGGAEAIDMLSGSPFDVVVCDLRMPGLDGADLLDVVRRRQPGAVRIILSGHAERGSNMRSLSVAHQFLAKPCEPAELESAIDAAQRRRPDDQIDERLVALIGGLDRLPSPTHVVMAMQDAIAADPPDIEAVRALVSGDAALATKVLQLSNSAFVGLARTITDPGEAVTFLGMGTLRDIIVSEELFQAFDNGAAATRNAVVAIHAQSRERAAMAAALARAAGGSRMAAQDASVSGLLADVGTLALLAVGVELPDPWADDTEPGVDRAHGAHHHALDMFGDVDGTVADLGESDAYGWVRDAAPQLGAYLLSAWGLPEPTVQCVAQRGLPPSFTHEQRSGLIWVADQMIEHPGEIPPEIELHAVGLTSATVRAALAMVA